MAYKMDYGGDAPTQAEGATALTASTPQPVAPAHKGITLRLPPVMQTVMVVTVVAGAFFAVEKYAPSEWRPSHLIGNYEAEVAARVESEVAAAKLEQQAQFDAWVEQVRLVNGQNLEQYRGVVQAVAANYQASYDRSRVYAEATARMQGDLAQARLRLASRTRQTDMGYINFSRMLGIGLNALTPGSGDSLMEFSRDLESNIYSELDRAASAGQTVAIDGWDTGLPPPDAVQASIAQLEPLPLPPPPHFDVTRADR